MDHVQKIRVYYYPLNPNYLLQYKIYKQIHEDHALAGLDGVEYLRMGQKHAFARPKRLVAVELENRLCRNVDAAGFEIADAELRALQIGEDADRMAMACRAGAHRVVKSLRPVMRRMAEVDAEDINAGNKQTFDHFWGS